MRQNLLTLAAVLTIGAGLWWYVSDRTARVPAASVADFYPRTSHVTIRTGPDFALVTDHAVTLTLTESGFGVGISMNRLPRVSPVSTSSIRLDGGGVALLEGPPPGGAVRDERALPIAGGRPVPPGETLLWYGWEFDFEGVGPDLLDRSTVALFYDLTFDADGDLTTPADSVSRMYLPIPKSGVDGLFELKPWER